MTRIALFVIAALSAVPALWACTNLLVTKGASADGSVTITYTADSAGFYSRLEIFPAADHSEGAVINIPATKDRPASKIEQAAHTHQVLGVVWDGNDLARQGCINEFQVAVAETTFGGREENHNPKGLLNYSLLMTLALQRSQTAREAIDVMVRLVDEYGYNDEGESISIADKEEAWVFEIVGVGPTDDFSKGGAIWVAKKVPDGEISVHANQARIGEIPEKSDSEHCRFSDNIIGFAVEKGWFNPNGGKPFHFADVYGGTDAKTIRVCASRVWSIYRRAAPSQNFSPDYHRNIEGTADYPWSIKPDKKLSTADVFALMRDHFDGTDFDMTQGIDAGDYGLPRRWRPLFWKVDDVEYSWERPISTQQTGFSIVTQSRSHLPDSVGGVLWYGVDDTYLSCYFPLYCGITELPPSYTVGSIKRFSWDSGWWVFNLVSNYANLKYDTITPDIIAVQKELETKFLALQAPVEKTAAELVRTDPILAQRYLTDYSVSQAESVTIRWRRLATDIFTKYNDGYIRSEDGTYPNVGYPDGWLRRVLKERPEQFKLPKPKETPTK